ncbi:hypothetical protein FRB97_005730 [Tulasnella sp. 331]|nr:hypothetical protein FRB97_005730 [Tulasnella sp. 331]
MLFNALSAILLYSTTVVLAVPVSEHKRAAVTPVSAAVISSYTPYEWFAAATYCTNGGAWAACGSTCAANSDFVQYAAGGDGDSVPHWYVGWSPSLGSIIVAHQGTDPTEFYSDLTDVEVVQDELTTALFPGIPSVHSGFLSAFESTATSVLAAVKALMTAHSTTKVTTVGHSLGGAIANLDAVYLKTNIPSISLNTVTFGEPRVGNAAWATYITNSYTITRVTHNYDPVPIVPFEDWGYEHPAGEIHIDTSGVWNSCAGIENGSTECEDGQVSSILDGVIDDHLGPYGPSQVWMGSSYC